MENITKDLTPKKVFYFFEELSKIPRGSKKEEAVSSWLVNFANESGLEVFKDSFLNVIIKKAGSKGHENFSPLILQGHTDMVWEKNEETVFDFETQGIELLIDNGFLKANGTTLGADNGIAVAVALAILDSDDIIHPPIEAVFTADEEAGMSGVENIDTSILNGKTMLNIDTEEEGEIYVSSAGGARIQIDLGIARDEKILNSSDLSLKIKGLNGGHSGADIDKNLGNSIKILAFILSGLSKRFSYKLYDISGGDKTNAIPREALSALNISETEKENFIKEANKLFTEIKADYTKTETNLTLEIIENSEINSAPISETDTKKIIDLLCELPNGVMINSTKIKDLVETSLSLGVLRTSKNAITIEMLLRSSVNADLKALSEKLEDIAKIYNADFTADSSYPSWEYNENSELRKLFINAHKEIYNTEPQIKAIHAGLECGIFANKIKELDVISIGPNIFGAHTPEERMEIKSVEYTWKWILKALELYNI